MGDDARGADVSSDQFPKDERFQRIASAISARVGLYLRDGSWPPIKASDKLRCRCPMGCFTPDRLRPASLPEQLRILGMTTEEFGEFVKGFDCTLPTGSAFEELGSKYRRRFP